MQTFRADIKIYDSNENLFFHTITNKDKREKEKNPSMFSKITPKSTKTINIAILDTLTDSYKLLFEENNDRDIRFLFFELEYNKEKKMMEIENNSYCLVLNNHKIKDRKPKDRLLLGLFVSEKLELWISDKRGKSLKKLVTIEKDEEWHLDINNCKVRVISANNSHFNIQNFDW